MRKMDPVARCVRSATGAERVNITVMQGRRRSSVGFAGKFAFAKEIFIDVEGFRFHIIGNSPGDPEDCRQVAEKCLAEFKRSEK